MSPATRQPAAGRGRRAERGAVLLMIMAVLGATILVSAGVLGDDAATPRDERLALAAECVDVLGRAAAEARRSSGAWPADLPSLVAAAPVSSLDLATADPTRPGFDVTYAVTAGVGVTVSAAGPDGVAGNGDDLAASASESVIARAPTRNRLALLRTAFLLSGYMDDPGMTPAERASLRDAVRDWSLARRAYLYADASGRAALQSQMDAAESTITSLRTSYGLPPIPPNATGPGGLLSGIGLPDSLGVDAFGNTFDTGLAGFVSRGADGSAGTPDDL